MKNFSGLKVGPRLPTGPQVHQARGASLPWWRNLTPLLLTCQGPHEITIFCDFFVIFTCGPCPCPAYLTRVGTNFVVVVVVCVFVLWRCPCRLCANPGHIFCFFFGFSPFLFLSRKARFFGRAPTPTQNGLILLHKPVGAGSCDVISPF